MAKTCKINLIEKTKISPPSKPNPSSSSLPLTLFDIPWLLFSPSKPLFFYEYPHSLSHFLSSTLPNLKHTLSLSLQLFFPFLGNLVFDSNLKPAIVYTDSDYISLTVQQSSEDFKFFTCDHPRHVLEFHPLVPELGTTTSSESSSIPLLAVKITVFPDLGICIGLAYHHVVADLRTFNNFIKAWAVLSCLSKVDSLPCFDRSVIRDPHDLELIFWNDLWKRKSLQKMVIGSETQVDLMNMVRATFVVSLSDMEKIKKWVVVKCKKKCEPLPVHLSPYVLACSFLWVCWVKAQTQMSQVENDEDPNYFGFIAGGLTRLDYPVPGGYFGNCVGFGRPEAIRRELIGDDGIVVAANVIGNMIKKLDKDIFSDAKGWISDWEVLFGSEVHVMIFGSPKVNLYGTDFGWGRPKKIEEISIDENRAISLSESRDLEGGIEIGISLPKSQMDVFSSLFNEELKGL